MKHVHLLSVALGIVLTACGGSGDATTPADGTTSTEALSSQAVTWENLGTSTVDGSFDQDSIVVGADDGRFDKIQIRVDGSALVMFGIKVVFGNGETFEPNVRLFFDANTRSGNIDLPGNLRFIRRVEFQYGNLPGGGRARVDLFGRSSTPPPAWEELGETLVNGTNDRDSLVIGHDEGPFTAIKVRVEHSSLVMDDIKVTFGDGQTFEPNVRLVFDANSTSRVIDLPGNKRWIKRVDFRYGNLPGGGDARVQLWATL